MSITNPQHDLVIAYWGATQEMLKRFTQADIRSVMNELKQQKMTWMNDPAQSNRIELQYGLFEKLLSFKVRAGDP